MPRYGTVTVRYCEAARQETPCVNVKVPPLYHRLPADVQDQDPDSAIFNMTAEDWWDTVPDDLAATFLQPAFPDCAIECHQEGRSSGWLCVSGIDLPAEWAAEQVEAWEEFESQVRQSIDDWVQVYVRNVRANLPPSRLATESHARCEDSRVCLEHRIDKRVPSCKRSSGHAPGRRRGRVR